MIDIEALAEARQKSAEISGKYIMPDGTNQAMYRNNVLDILEELADALNICMLLEKRLAAYDSGLIGAGPWVALNITVGKIKSIAKSISLIGQHLPEEFSRDLIPVTRILPEDFK